MSKATALAMVTGQPAAATPPPAPELTVVPPATPETTAATSPADPPATPKAEDPVQSNRLAIFAKKEASLQKEREQVKSEREAFAKEKAEADHYRTRGKQFDETFAKDKVAALRMLGLTDTDIINILAEVQKVPDDPVEAAKKAAQDLIDEDRKKREKADADAAAAQNERMIKQLKSDITTTITKNAEKYEYCAFEGAEAEHQAYEIIVENLKVNNELLTIEQALDIAEEFYEEKDRAMSALKKRQAKSPAVPAAEATTAAAPPAQAAPKSTAPSAPPSPPKTLTNRVAPTATGAAPVTRMETREEKKARLAEKLRNGG